MRIPIVDNIIMTSDASNFILNRELTIEEGENKGKKHLSAYAFYPTVIQALESCLNEKMGESAARSLTTLIREHHELVDCFRTLLGTKEVLEGTKSCEKIKESTDGK